MRDTHLTSDTPARQERSDEERCGKVARRGVHLSREYSAEPLELMTVKDVMSRYVVTLLPSLPLKQSLGQYFAGRGGRTHHGYPVIDDLGRLVGIVTRSNLLEPSLFDAIDALVVADILERELVAAYAEESWYSAAEKMAQARRAATGGRGR